MSSAAAAPAPSPPPASPPPPAPAGDDASIEAEEAGGRLPVVVRGKSTFRTSDIAEVLTCPLCKGYFRAARTITECMHTFCTGCLYKQFRAGLKGCPTCATPFQGAPENCTMSDAVINDLVGKLFPEKPGAEIDFYESRGIKRKAEYPLEEPAVEKEVKKKKVPYVNSEDELNFQLLPVPADQIPTTSDKTVSELELPRLSKPFLRTSGRLKILQIKKYLNKKLANVPSPKAISVFCQGDLLGDELNLTFLKRTRWLNTSKDLTLHYRLKVDED
ncbi:hypothetical protein TeGR_g8782 [Tetraparma gracilis]|uniref:RING-type domain-containing protein n=1 Tax=Tetraparma gracilis TaxID=2962635 RepID=A0ABQ6NA75_9STRA|nr:hypothetical protein TeGR_g8782 [Tetraparma gracilis]